MLGPTPWAANVRIGTGTFAPSIAVDRSGNVFIAVERGDGFIESVQLWMSGDGTTFTKVFAYPPPSNGFPSLTAEMPAVVVDGQDRLIMKWLQMDLSGAG
jgi:hypothetical protein